MMIRFIFMMSAVFVFTANGFANDKSSGCGLGWKVTKRNSLTSSAVRNFTNAASSNTSGMTSGTSGCAKHSIVQNEKAAVHFAEANLDQLMMDMVKGNGMFLSAFAQTFGCSEAGMQEFGRISRQQLQKTLASPTVSPVGLVRDLQDEIQTNIILSSSCSV